MTGNDLRGGISRCKAARGSDSRIRKSTTPRPTGLSASNTGRRAKQFAAKDIGEQFQGMSVEFNDPVTLFPVDVERQDRQTRNSRSATVRRLSS